MDQNDDDICMESNTVQSIERAFDVLFSFESMQKALTLTEISKITGLAKPTVQRILKTLEKKGIAKENQITKQWIPTFRLYQLSCIALDLFDLKQAALPWMRKLANTTGDAIGLNITEGGQRVCIERIESAGIYRLYLALGLPVPMYKGATGKVLLANLTKLEQDKILEKGLKEKKIESLDVLKKELFEIKKQGYYVTIDELGMGVAAAAAPIFGSSKQLLGCISVSGPLSKYANEKFLLSLKEDLLRATEEISIDMGYKK